MIFYDSFIHSVTQMSRLIFILRVTRALMNASI